MHKLTCGFVTVSTMTASFCCPMSTGTIILNPVDSLQLNCLIDRPSSDPFIGVDMWPIAPSLSSSTFVVPHSSRWIWLSLKELQTHWWCDYCIHKMGSSLPGDHFKNTWSKGNSLHNPEQSVLAHCKHSSGPLQVMMINTLVMCLLVVLKSIKTSPLCGHSYSMMTCSLHLQWTSLLPHVPAKVCKHFPHQIKRWPV